MVNFYFAYFEAVIRDVQALNCLLDQFKLFLYNDHLYISSFIVYFYDMDGVKFLEGLLFN